MGWLNASYRPRIRSRCGDLFGEFVSSEHDDMRAMFYRWVRAIGSQHD
jgi:hypothetical protein